MIQAEILGGDIVKSILAVTVFYILQVFFKTTMNYYAVKLISKDFNFPILYLFPMWVVIEFVYLLNTDYQPRFTLSFLYCVVSFVLFNMNKIKDRIMSV